MTLRIAFQLLVAGSMASAQTPTPVPACPGKATHGALQVLQSDVPELALDSARWEVTTERAEFGYETHLLVHARLTATRETPLAGIGVLFESRRDTSIVWPQITTEFSEARLDPVLSAGNIITFHRVTPARPAPVSIYASEIGRAPAKQWGCPTRARIVRLMNVATHIGLVSRVARDSSAILTTLRNGGRPLRPLEVLADTLAPVFGEKAVVGVAVNTTDRTLHDAAVWMEIRYPGGAANDTLVFPIGDIAPHALAPFGGGGVQSTDSRSNRGGWTDADPGSRVTAEFENSMRVFRLARNGTVRRSLRASDEVPSSDDFQWDAATFDLDTALAYARRGVFAILHGPTASKPAREEFAVIGSKSLYRAGPSRTDSARLTTRQMGELGNAAKVPRSIRPIPEFPGRPLTAQDSVALRVQPGIGEEVITLKTAPDGVRRVLFPAGAPPPLLRPLYDALLKLEAQARARADRRSP